ncbi:MULTISPECIES: Na+/H+ antiporter subunit D [Micrococcus]|uniref:Na+/H+ antiporter subunit D n=1 Tax=Micrococcus luteus TaxID=1270 RepID=UPI000BF30310|nr:Na+/H+ antiporter subunit D [Micrococcus luteus]PFH05896.1 multisubunit sodium/proton antiporter MrpD subunit [Micrococcaceae bacterium JKS001869]MBN6768517.1 Na+/H+ antiporter subunit D [Micrococcus luteus]MBN6828034.1 Na+/H+ antiporter subunit D [Micrococcus luteus]MBN6846780.1 Na+/H+ antiporter subunit D [Micrococcus luteus]MBN6862654.1 Na+/H+ antiporter subunit D [Micrococcus luteus]
MSIGSVPLTDLAPLAVMLPVLGAAVTFMLVRRPRAQITVTVSALVLTLVLDALLLAAVWDTGVAAVHLGGWPAPLGISLVVDRLSALMLVVSALITLAVLLYASAQGLINRDEGGPVSIFHPTFLILVAGVSNAFLAGDLFNLYVGFEILLTASYVLLTMGGTAQRIRAGITYVVVSVISSVVFLIAIAMVYAATGTMNMADLAVKLGELPSDVQMVLHVLLLVGFGIKAAVFPLSFWLPDSYPTAPAPVTAVFAGLLTKVGVYAMIRTETLLFPGEHVNALLLVVAALTMVVGILGALAQTDIKRILSFILVSHIGYMIFGLGLATEAGLAATVYYVAHHITVQTALFLVTGLIENRAGTANIDRLGSLAKVSPFVGVLFLVPALNLGGIPPFSGFLGKVGLLRGGVEQATPLAYTLVGVSLLVSLLTLLVVVRVWTRAFWRRVEDVEHPPAQLVAAYERAVARGERPRPLEPGLVLPTTALVGLTLVFTVAAGPLFALADEAATDMLDRSPYIAAVLDDAAAERAARNLSVDPTEVHDARK